MQHANICSNHGSIRIFWMLHIQSRIGFASSQLRLLHICTRNQRLAKATSKSIMFRPNISHTSHYQNTMHHEFLSPSTPLSISLLSLSHILPTQYIKSFCQRPSFLVGIPPLIFMSSSPLSISLFVLKSHSKCPISCCDRILHEALSIRVRQRHAPPAPLGCGHLQALDLSTPVLMVIRI